MFLWWDNYSPSFQKDPLQIPNFTRTFSAVYFLFYFILFLGSFFNDGIFLFLGVIFQWYTFYFILNFGSFFNDGIIMFWVIFQWWFIIIILFLKNLLGGVIFQWWKYSVSFITLSWPWHQRDWTFFSISHFVLKGWTTLSHASLPLWDGRQDTTYQLLLGLKNTTYFLL
jgi:hypothetical protein